MAVRVRSEAGREWSDSECSHWHAPFRSDDIDDRRSEQRRDAVEAVQHQQRVRPIGRVANGLHSLNWVGEEEKDEGGSEHPQVVLHTHRHTQQQVSRCVVRLTWAERSEEGYWERGVYRCRTSRSRI